MTSTPFSMSACKVLCVCSVDTVAENVRRALTMDDAPARVEFTRAGTMLDGLGELARNPFDVIVAEMRPPDSRGLDASEQFRRQAPGIPLILLSRSADRDAAMAAVRGGARDFFSLEDLDSEALRRSVQKASEVSAAGVTAATPARSDRRNNARFPCRLAITWRTLEQPLRNGEGISETLNISSKGILFASNEQFEPGQLLQVSLDWPARLGNEVPLKLVAEGRVLRTTEGKAAMTIERYEFRTRRATPASAGTMRGVPAAGVGSHSEKAQSR